MSAPPYVYFDNSATTAMDPRVVEAMAPFFSERYGNPSSQHRPGRVAFQALDDARGKVATAIGARTSEMIFTGGGTESDNLAIIGYALANRSKGDHIITSQIEHPAVMRAFYHLGSLGFKTTYLPVDHHGFVSLEDLKESMTKDTILVSIVTANNEIGTVQPIREASDIAHDGGAVFHTDAVQAACRMPLSVITDRVDMLSLAAHKFHGPKGVGALYIKQGLKLSPLVHGGGQEKGLRSSTENVPGAVGMGEALRLGVQELEENVSRMRRMRDHLVQGVLDQVDGSFINGHPTHRLCHNAHLCLPGHEGESLVLGLDLAGFAVSTGSACSSKGGSSSGTLKAIGLSPEHAKCSIRITLSKFNNDEDVERFLAVLPWVLGGIEELMETMSDQCGFGRIKR
jgi:cysteine desulfurase